MKKWAILLLILVNILSIQAINLEVNEEPISNSYIIELEKPAVYQLTIKNLGQTDEFEVYSLVGIDITHDLVKISANQTKKVQIQLTPQSSLRSEELPFTFEYRIRNSKEEIQKETISMNIVSLKSAFLIEPEPVTIDSENVILTIKNNLLFDFPEILIKSTSAFFDYDNTLSFQPLERKEIVIPIDKEKLKTLNAGNYLINSKIDFENKSADIESQIKFLEQEGIESTDNKEGTIIKREEIVRKNIGNIRKTVTITTQRDIFSYLFTTTSLPPTETETKDLTRIYTWEKELIPNEELKIIIRTNWLYPFIILIILIIATVLIRKSVYANLELTKKVSFVKTKGGEFALKVTIKAKAKNQINKITIIDRIPHLVKLYHRFGLIPPDKIDNDKRLEWNIPSLNKDETRIFTYIIYSKIGVFGRFQLPEAKAIYEHDGRVKEAVSNKSFYVNEPRE